MCTVGRKVGVAAVLGVGLIGGSLAKALKAAGWEVRGFDRDRDSLDYAEERRIIDRGYTIVALAVAGADLVCLATPPAVIPDLLRKCVPHLKIGCIVTDVASTKARLVQTAEEILPPSVSFVGGHPMAGSEQSGVKASSPRLLVGVPYILTPTERTDSGALDRLRELVRRLGARPVVMPPEEHDFCVAAVSHLPQVVASALVNLLRRVDEERNKVTSLAASGFRDTTRVASSNPFLWRDICLGNQEQICRLLKAFRETVAEFEAGLNAGDGERILSYFAQAKAFRDGLFRDIGSRQGGHR